MLHLENSPQPPYISGVTYVAKKMDKFAVFATILMLLLGAGLAYWGWYSNSKIYIGGSLFVCAIIVIFHSLMAQAYEIETNKITIYTSLFQISFQIDDVNPINMSDQEFSPIRVAGNGGLFGYNGLFYSKNFGWLLLFTTTRKGLIGYRSKNSNRIICISPSKQP